MQIVYGLYDSADLSHCRYIGKSVDPKERLIRHLSNARIGGRTYKATWMRSVVNAGRQVVLVELAPSTRLASELERHCIVVFKAHGHRLTNLTDGGEGTPGWRHSESTRAKIGAGNKGRRHVNRRHRPISEASRMNMSAGQIGRRFTPEHRQKISEARKAYWRRKRAS